jgi:hypothetical protein
VCIYVRYKLATTEIGVQMDVGVSIVKEEAAVVSVLIYQPFFMIEQQFYSVHSSSRHRPFDRKNTSKIKLTDKVLSIVEELRFEGYDEEALRLPV